jgi:hypothetical protein
MSGAEEFISEAEISRSEADLRVSEADIRRSRRRQHFEGYSISIAALRNATF